VAESINPGAVNTAPATQQAPTAVETTLPDSREIINAFANERNFVAAQRIARLLMSSTLVPKAYAESLPNTLIAMELANRIGASVFMVMQNLDVIQGTPGWRSKFLIATVNSCGRFSALKFRWEGTKGAPDWGCRAYAKELSSGEECLGPAVTMAIATAEGWLGRSGSKWKTIPELMMMYRAGAFWTRLYAPELSLGLNTSEEVIDITPEASAPAGIAPGASVTQQVSAAAAQVLEQARQDGQLPKAVSETYESARGEAPAATEQPKATEPPPTDKRPPGRPKKQPETATEPPADDTEAKLAESLAARFKAHALRMEPSLAEAEIFLSTITDGKCQKFEELGAYLLAHPEIVEKFTEMMR
jgi:hypothetical protein